MPIVYFCCSFHVLTAFVRFRWPYGPVAIVAPFNFPLEIPVLQMMGALYMGYFYVIFVRL